MDAPPIQYAKTADGVNIAYWAIGEGPPLVILPNLQSSDLQRDWEGSNFGPAYRRLAERAMVIRYDPRGYGHSQGESFGSSAEAQALDLEAVANHLGLHEFAIYGARTSGEVLLAYPGSHPERVSHLIVSVPPFPRGVGRSFAAIQPLMEQHWELFTEIYGRLLGGWDERRGAEIAARIRLNHTPSTFELAVNATLFPVEPLLTAITVPTLVLHRPDGSAGTTRHARTLASGISGAHLVGIPNWPLGSTFNETVVAAILEFINAPAAPGAPIAAPQVDISAVRTIVFTDVEGSTALNERFGDEGARKVLREHERLTREALGAHGGSEVKAMGDGFMTWFPSATRAVECAIALQRAFSRQSPSLPARPEALVGRAEPQPPANEPLRVRIGINAGEPIAEGDDLFGASVIATARICAQATGGQILASDVVRQLLAGKGFTFADQGEHSLKGFDEPARLFEVRWQAHVSS